MAQLANEGRLQIGFLRIAQTDQGYVGGLLVTNHLGRPLEFQCTTPVRPNRTQEILYGSTLQPFIYAELIGKTLFERLAIKPQLLVIQQEELFDLRRHIELPLGLLSTKETATGPTQALGRQVVTCHAEFPQDAATIQNYQNKIPADADLQEPLERVKDALQETLRANAVA
ncbi:hypothetical protein [Planctomicrobium sp. SH664]|uniref:hypothetical protein n=1 Tax=Planctomicrobium sp. SH664 TaxID=3448125 RepID=UPI003F5C34E6